MDKTTRYVSLCFSLCCLLIPFSLTYLNPSVLTFSSKINPGGMLDCLVCYVTILYWLQMLYNINGKGEGDNECIVTNGGEIMELVINYYILMNVPEQYHKILSLWLLYQLPSVLCKRLGFHCLCLCHVTARD